MGFEKASLLNKKYVYIFRSLNDINNINLFWQKFHRLYPEISISNSLKTLYIQMISFLPDNRPTIKEIYHSEWMKEIRFMTKEQLDKLELEVKEEFSKREKEIIEAKQIKMNIKKQNNNIETSSGNRTINDEKDLINPDIKLNYAETGLNMEYYIKINGKMNPNGFMNELITEIKNNYKKDCDTEPSETEIKFRLYLEPKNDDYESIPNDIKEEIKNLGINSEEINDNDNEDIKGQSMTIEIKLFESQNGGYLLTFEKIKGNKTEFLDNIKTISSLIQNII